MKVDVTQILKNYEGQSIYEERRKRDDKGKTIKDEKGEPVPEEIELTLRSVISTSLLSENIGEGKPRTAEDKNKSRPILNKLWEGKWLDISTKDAGYVIEKVETFFNPLVIDRVNSMFDRADEKKVKKGKTGS